MERKKRKAMERAEETRERERERKRAIMMSVGISGREDTVELVRDVEGVR